MLIETNALPLSWATISVLTGFDVKQLYCLILTRYYYAKLLQHLYISENA